MLPYDKEKGLYWGTYYVSAFNAMSDQSTYILYIMNTYATSSCVWSSPNGYEGQGQC